LDHAESRSGALGVPEPLKGVLGKCLTGELFRCRGAQARERGVDPGLQVLVTLVLVLAGLEEAFELVGVPGADRFRGFADLILADGSGDHCGDRCRRGADLAVGDRLVGCGGHIPSGQMGQVDGASLLGVVS
jgi:hypothetical protein